MVRTIVRIEGLAIFLVSLFLYQQTGVDWMYFLLFILVPDISMIGYLKDKKLGAIPYNLVHNYVLSVILVGLWFLTETHIFLTAGIVLSAHVGIDRFFGFGLKYPSNFKDTHIQKL